MRMTVETISFALEKPFAITGHVFKETNTVRVSLEDGGARGRGEGAGVYYLDETAESMSAQLRDVIEAVERGASRREVQELLPLGGARNALDCAYWDLEAKKAGARVWDLVGRPAKPLTTVFTLGIASAEEMAAAAAAAQAFPNIKVKLDADRPVEKIEAIRTARPDASLVIDVNQGWSMDELREYAPAMERARVAMIEQPLPRGGDEALEGYRAPVPLGADESCLDTSEFDAARNRYDVINIKLDKTGGFTEAMKLVALAEEAGKTLMVGNMVGSSLSMAPSFVVGQACRFVDIDGPLFLARDIEDGLNYGPGGVVEPPRPELWG